MRMATSCFSGETAEGMLMVHGMFLDVLLALGKLQRTPQALPGLSSGSFMVSSFIDVLPKNFVM